MNNSLTALQTILGYNFSNVDLLIKALTHSSYANQHNLTSNERMEFLGDAVLQIIVSKYIYDHSKQDEGELSKIRSSIVSAETLSAVARSLKLQEYLYLGDSQLMLRDTLHLKIYANLYESILCGIYLDGGYINAQQFVLNTLSNQLDQSISGNFYSNPKTMLQEYCQKNKISIKYKQAFKRGPDHNPEFCYELYLDGVLVSSGLGGSKLIAQTVSASNALEIISKKEQK
ncbi:MAG: ribonuclease III [Clostridia bacterium]